MVCQLSFYTGNPDAMNSIVLKHLPGHIAASHSAWRRYFGVLVKLGLQIRLNQVTGYGYAYENNPIHALRFEIVYFPRNIV